jgi:hypothetical protein
VKTCVFSGRECDDRFEETHALIDENAFGVLLAHYDLESIEYSLEHSAFVEYLGRFSSLIEGRFSESPLANGLRKIDLGHAQYFEFADGDQLVDPISWVREMRKAFVAVDLPNVCLLSAGGRWVTEVPSPAPEAQDVKIEFGPSEPLRKALAAEVSAQPNTAAETEQSGWGPGLYVEKDAIEQLGRSLKNAPTALPVLSSIFYRIGA